MAGEHPIRPTPNEAEDSPLVEELTGLLELMNNPHPQIHELHTAIESTKQHLTAFADSAAYKSAVVAMADSSSFANAEPELQREYQARIDHFVKLKGIIEHLEAKLENAMHRDDSKTTDGETVH